MSIPYVAWRVAQMHPSYLCGVLLLLQATDLQTEEVQSFLYNTA